MIWSEQELANMPLAGEKVAIEKVMKHLDDPGNSAIFTPENFSFLWGVLGLVGVVGASDDAKTLIWESLKQNGAVDAYDKGILGDFNHHLAEKCNDNRMRAWIKFDNYQAGEHFKKIILHELLKTNLSLEKEAISYCLDGNKLLSELSTIPMTPQVKVYLEQLRGIEVEDSAFGMGINAYEKEEMLRKLCDTIVYAKRHFLETEKDYLFFYLRQAVNSGFDAKRIGIDDRVLSRLMASREVVNLSELEVAPMLMRNAEIMEFAEPYEEKDGFYEETAARFVHLDKTRILAMLERCLALISSQRSPRGVLFALELLNLGQVKSSVQVLAELARKGQATEMTCFMHRLLTKAKGAEALLLDILKTNLNQQKNKPFWEPKSSFNLYLTRLYIQAIRAFAEAGCAKQSAALLIELTEGRWWVGFDDFVKSFTELANQAILADTGVMDLLVKQARRLGLKIFSDGEYTFIGQPEDNPLTAMRRKIQETVKNATTLDLSGMFDKMSKAEASTYDVYQNFKNKLYARKNDDEPANPDLHDTGLIENFENLTNEIEYEINPLDTTSENVVNNENVVDSSADAKGAEAPKKIISTFYEEPFWENGEEIYPPSVDENGDTHESIPEVENKDAVTTSDVAAPIAEPMPTSEDLKADGQNNVLPTERMFDNATVSLDDVKQEGSQENDVKEEAEKKPFYKNKININNILKLKPKDVDKHFEKIKEITSSAIKRAEEQANKIKDKVNETNITSSPSVEKIKTLASKIKFFKKK